MGGDQSRSQPRVIMGPAPELSGQFASTRRPDIHYPAVHIELTSNMLMWFRQTYPETSDPSPFGFLGEMGAARGRWRSSARSSDPAVEDEEVFHHRARRSKRGGLFEDRGIFFEDGAVFVQRRWGGGLLLRRRERSSKMGGYLRSSGSEDRSEDRPPLGCRGGGLLRRRGVLRRWGGIVHLRGRKTEEPPHP